MAYYECRYIFPSGLKCKSPCITDQDLCFFHGRRKQVVARPAPPAPFEDYQLDLPQLEDGDSIQLALSKIITALANGWLDRKRAGLLLYTIQIASANLPKTSGLGSRDAVRETFTAEDGALLGPRVRELDGEDWYRSYKAKQEAEDAEEGEYEESDEEEGEYEESEDEEGEDDEAEDEDAEDEDDE